MLLEMVGLASFNVWNKTSSLDPRTIRQPSSSSISIIQSFDDEPVIDDIGQPTMSHIDSIDPEQDQGNVLYEPFLIA